MLVFKQSPLLLVASVLVVASLAGAQNKNVQTKALSIPVTDLGTSESPITPSGNVVIVEKMLPDSVQTQWNMMLQLTNMSGKAIVAYEFVVTATPEHGLGVNDTYEADSFFRPESDFQPGAQRTATGGYPGWQVVPEKAGSPPGKTWAKFRLVFVEFADGSKYGTSRWATCLSDARERAIKRMQQAEAAYAASGKDGLHNALATALATNTDPLTSCAALLYLKNTFDSSGAETALAEINEFLARAEERKDIR